MNCWQRTITSDVALGWLALRSLVKTGHSLLSWALVDVNMHLMPQSAMTFSSLPIFTGH